MSAYFVFGLGFVAQALFASRMIIQWIQSEKAGRVLSPTLFWQTSLIASFLLLVYGILRHDAVIFFGQALSYYIYIRNLQIKHSWNTFPLMFRTLVFIMPVVLIAWMFFDKQHLLISFSAHNDFLHPMMITGVAGQVLLNFRFVYQWYFSERIHESVFPAGFWVISLAGSILIIFYGIYRNDPVLLVAQALGFVIYLRNIILGKSHSIE
jgi:lipid-A-disaccharide synthase-like uncharacterized protein